MIKLSWYGHSLLGLAVGGTAILIDPCFTGSPAASTTTEVSLLAHDLVTRRAQAGSPLRTAIRALTPGESVTI